MSVLHPQEMRSWELTAYRASEIPTVSGAPAGASWDGREWVVCARDSQDALVGAVDGDHSNSCCGIW